MTTTTQIRETLGHQLERQRLHHRERRIAAVLSALRADEIGARAAAQPQLRSAIRDFQQMRTSVRRRLDQLERSESRRSR